jgi:hypothetical protein
MCTTNAVPTAGFLNANLLHAVSTGLGSTRTSVTNSWDRCYDFENIFAEKFSENIGVFCSNYSLFFGKKLIITLVFEKNANFFAEKWQKSQKIVIITSTPGRKLPRSDGQEPF